MILKSKDRSSPLRTRKIKEQWKKRRKNMTLKEALDKGINIYSLYLDGSDEKLPREKWLNYLDKEICLNQEDDIDEEGNNGGYIWGKIKNEKGGK